MHHRRPESITSVRDLQVKMLHIAKVSFLVVLRCHLLMNTLHERQNFPSLVCFPLKGISVFLFTKSSKQDQTVQSGSSQSCPCL